MECAYQIFSFGQIDARFATNGTINHGEKRGGYLNEIDSAQISCCNETRQVTNDSSAQGNDIVVSRKFLLCQKREKVFVINECFI